MEGTTPKAEEKEHEKERISTDSFQGAQLSSCTWVCLEFSARKITKANGSH